MLKNRQKTKFKFDAIGTLKGKEKTKQLEVMLPVNSLIVAKEIAIHKARLWAYENNFENFRLV